MKLIVLLFGFLAIVKCVQSTPQAGPPTQSEENLSPQCRTPKCPDNENINLPYPMDCLLYVKCTKGVRKISACPAETSYNEAAGICTDARTANCVNCWQKAPSL